MHIHNLSHWLQSVQSNGIMRDRISLGEVIGNICILYIHMYVL